MESWSCEVMDVDAAFLEGDMEEKLFLRWSCGVLDFSLNDQATIDESCLLLKKAIYSKV